jgi:diguanylate cyclase (GGDEF)-like protein
MFEPLPSVLVRSPGDVAGQALFVVDTTSGTLSFVNSVAAELFALRVPSGAFARAADVVPELADLTPRRFAASARGPAGDVRVDVTVTELAGGPAGGALVLLRPLQIVSAPRAPRPGERRSERLESLWTLVVRRGLGGADQVRAILREAIRGLGLDHAELARVDRGELVVEFTDVDERAGESVPIESALARRAVAGSGTFAVLDTALDAEFARVADRTRSFLCSAFRVGEERWVVTFSSAAPRAQTFPDDDWEYVDHVLEAVARAIERRDNDARIERLAYYDGLTSLPNRVALHARLDEALAESDRSGARAAVLFLDIDGFKAVNDTVGHRGGDLVLAEVAQRLRGTLRRDEYIGRLGGDEFAIVMPCIADRTEIESIAQRIGGVLTFPFAVEGYRFSLSASIGVAIYPDDAKGRDDLLACADAAMYSAKDDGGSRVRFRDAAANGTAPGLAPIPANGAARASGASHGARSALASEPRDIGYLLCYQPILDLRTGGVSAAEALIRRIHPVHGLLAPERGWSIAHDDAGRRALDRWVLREAASQARTWHDAGMPIRVDVNLAAYDVEEIDLLLADERLAVDARRVRVEISARQFAEDDGERFVRFVDRCAEGGIGFALDAFDGGLGVLPAISHLPFDALKLDRPLIETISVSRTTRAIVEGSIGVARSLGWSVIAKGVETGAQHEALVAVGCDAMQGFYVAHPMTSNDFGSWLRERVAPAERQA